MGMVVRTNTMALNAYRQLGMNNSAVSKSLEKLSSGFRINRAGDDAAGLAISEKMKAQITGLETASANAQDGISLIQTAEGNLTEVHSMLNRMVELATKSANGTYTQTERDALQDEVDALLDEIDRISQSANFNGTNLLDGTMGLNKSAFAVDEAAAVDAVEPTPIDLSAKLPTKITATDNDGTQTSAEYETQGATAAYHTGKGGTEEVQPSFKISLGDLSVKDAAGKTAGSTLALNIAGVTVTTATLTGTKTTDDIANAIVTAVNATAGKGTGKGIEIGNALYTATNKGNGIIEFKYAGDKNSSETNSSTDDPIKSTMTSPSGTVVNITWANAANVEVSGSINHNTFDVVNPVEKVDGGRAGMDITLDNTIVKEGATLTIDGKSFIFKTEKDGSDNSIVTGTTGDTFNGATVIDVSNLAANKQIAEAIDLLSQQGQAGGFTLHAKGDSILHAEQTIDDAKNKVYDTYDKLKEIFSAGEGGSDAKAGGTTLTLTADKIVKGDAITVGDKTYTFVEEGSGANGAPATGEILMGKNGTDAMKNLETALKADAQDFTVEKNGTTFTFRPKDIKKAAPFVIGGGLTLQIGDTADKFNKMNVSVANMSAKGLGLNNLSIKTENLASDAIDKIKTAINTVSTARAGMGALQNRLEHTINNLDVAVENLSAANSRIRDTDMAKEMMNYTKMNVLVQSAQAMLAQANQQPQSVLQLLQ